eukprot:354575_1
MHRQRVFLHIWQYCIISSLFILPIGIYKLNELLNPLHYSFDFSKILHSNISNKSNVYTDFSYYHTFVGSTIRENFSTHSNLCNSSDHLVLICAHKTGGFLKSWIPSLIEECNFTNINARKNSNVLKYHELIIWKERKWKNLNAICKVLSMVNDGSKFVALMMVREPLFTILSGFNYHAQGNEIWPKRNMTQKTLHPRGYGKPLYHCFKDVFNDSKYAINYIETTMYNEYKKGFNNNYANDEALQYGLYLEFTRFVNCEWNIHYSNYIGIKKHVKYFLFVRFNWFSEYNAKKSTVYVLKQLGIDNKVLLSKMLDTLEYYQHEAIVNKTRHSTVGSFNKTHQIHLLLNYNQNVCLHIKKMNILLDFEWKYTQYC